MDDPGGGCYGSQGATLQRLHACAGSPRLPLSLDLSPTFGHGAQRMDLDTTEQLRMWTVVDGHRRILNVIVAVAGILLLMPLMVLIVIAIRLT